MNKLTQSQVNDNISPFDSIKHTDNQGNEFWYARELMKLMGYTNWRKFNGAIEQAKENLELNGDIVVEHFDLKVKKSKGRNAKDYKLTRLACYHVALSCDHFARRDNLVKRSQCGGSKQLDYKLITRLRIFLKYPLAITQYY